MPVKSSRRQAESRLFAAYAASGDPRTRDAVIEHFLPLARAMARRYRGATEPLEDLEQVASLALVRAVEGFDPGRGTAFSSYAVPSITGALKRHYRDHGWAVRVPRDLQDLALRVQRVTEALTTDSGRVPTADEVARAARVTVEAVLEAREAWSALRSASIDQPRGGPDPDATSLLDTLGESDEALSLADDRATLNAWLETLGHRERTIVLLYYREELTQAEIGRRLGYSQMHVSRLLRNAVDHLHDAALAQDGELERRLTVAA